MKIKVGKYVWNSKKCVPMQVIKHGFMAFGVYALGIISYYMLLPISTIG